MVGLRLSLVNMGSIATTTATLTLTNCAVVVARLFDGLRANGRGAAFSG